MEIFSHFITEISLHDILPWYPWRDSFMLHDVLNNAELETIQTAFLIQQQLCILKKSYFRSAQL